MVNFKLVQFLTQETIMLNFVSYYVLCSISSQSTVLILTMTQFIINFLKILFETILCSFTARERKIRENAARKRIRKSRVNS